MNACAFPIAKPKSNNLVRQPAVGHVYVAGHDTQIDTGLALAGIDAQGKTWWDVCDALSAAGDNATAGRAESLAIPF